MCYFVQHLVQGFLSMNTCYLTELFNPVWVRVGRMATLSQKLGTPTSRVSAVGKLQTSLIWGTALKALPRAQWAGLGWVPLEVSGLQHLQRYRAWQAQRVTNGIRDLSTHSGLFHWGLDKQLKSIT